MAFLYNFARRFFPEPPQPQQPNVPPGVNPDPAPGPAPPAQPPNREYQPPQPAPGEHVRNFVLNPPMEEELVNDPQNPGAVMAGIAAHRELDHVQKYNQARCYAHLKYKIAGRPLDSNFKMYCYSVMNAYFDSCKLYDTQEKLRLADECFKELIKQLPKEPRWITQENRPHLLFYSYQQKGILLERKWYWPFSITHSSLDDAGNDNGLPPLPTSFNMFHQIMFSLGVATTVMGVSYLIYRLRPNPTPGITIQDVQKLLEQHLSTVTTLANLQNTTPPPSPDSTSILKSLFTTLSESAITSIAIVWSRRAKDSFISVISNPLKMESLQDIPSHHFPR
uniref:Uncharacterized protein n=1 Tax=Neuropteran tombus-related virus TaxID=2822557 RepID=A0A8A6RSY6_9TOMB|nr:hypothetical protein [Neuropteran tombus-related virus]